MEIKKEKLVRKEKVVLYARVKRATKEALVKLAEKQGYKEKVGELIDSIVREIK